MAYPQKTFSQTSFPAPSFISRRRQVVCDNTLLYQLNVLKTTGRYDAFKLRWRKSYADPPDVWPVPNHLFWDSDIAKWIEGACYFLTWQENEEVDAAIKELVGMIRAAQQEDGYLNIHFTVVEPLKRFSNIRDLHELYNAGHLIEAALAHNDHYKNDLLLEPILKYVDLLNLTFGPGPEQLHGYPGHPEIELALLRLYEKTKDVKHLDLARYFIEERGNPAGQDGQHYYDMEGKRRGDRDYEKPGYLPYKERYSYQQAHKPIIEQQTIKGHSVRAMYLLTAVADLVRLEPSKKVLQTAVTRLWDNMVDKKMYLTGGIGAIKQWEGFGIDYFLPSGTDEGGCYAETCAAIGVMMLAERILQLDLNGKYGDIMELCFYNAVMTGMSTSGKQFTYVNQLASSESDLSKRAEWFTCACCPPNVTRLLGYIGGYLWSSKTNAETTSVEVNVHLYSSAQLTVTVGDKVVKLQQSSNWPWEGKIAFSLDNPSEVTTTIKLRIPGWAEKWEISPEIPDAYVETGYLSLPAEWLKLNSSFELNIPLKPRFISPHPYTNQDVIALARGPLIYCVEDVDNPWVNDHFKSLLLGPTKAVDEVHISADVIGEPYVQLTLNNAASILSIEKEDPPAIPCGGLVQRGMAGIEKLVFIPYALRDNRGGKGMMRVGIRNKH